MFFNSVATNTEVKLQEQGKMLTDLVVSNSDVVFLFIFHSSNY